MPVININDPHSRFKAAAKKVQKCLAENIAIDAKIDELQYVLNGVRGINYEKTPGSHSPRDDDSQRMSLWEAKETYEARKRANTALIQWVFSVMEDIRMVNVEDYHHIFALYICRYSLSALAESAGVSTNSLCIHIRKVLNTVMTEKRIAELDVIEGLLSVLGSPRKTDLTIQGNPAAGSLQDLLADSFRENA